ncbi:MAG: OmpH family outer membrane protein [Candidatus Parabeggiatoa sp. nov. 3]|nr:MAG: OmpH family outer membrane protein [Gammaproteobacteria bacterium]RKZ68975.1 MAG: OmpH family outer membrane protein [Gammaproteobacteria bacterium]RKZ89777.1 MAG: OmpH family outer membrane protein [Gammaproteobacteria bacterium]HEW98491.1 OmpH family outer membrane protein [Beggiatoa sp.]
MKIRHFIIVGLLCSMFFPAAAIAEIKIGFVNAIKLMDQAPQFKRAITSLNTEFAGRQQELIDAGQDLKDRIDRFNKDAQFMSEAKAQKKSQKIRQKQREFQREQEAFQKDYNIRHTEELNKIQKSIRRVIQDIVRIDGYDLILSEGVVWASESIDITDQVLSRLEWQ